MFCPKCGAELREGARFCGSCGAKLKDASVDDAPQETQPAAAKNRSKKPLAVGVVAVLVVAVIGVGAAFAAGIFGGAFDAVMGASEGDSDALDALQSAWVAPDEEALNPTLPDVYPSQVEEYERDDMGRVTTQRSYDIEYDYWVGHTGTNPGVAEPLLAKVTDYLYEEDRVVERTVGALLVNVSDSSTGSLEATYGNFVNFNIYEYDGDRVTRHYRVVNGVPSNFAAKKKYSKIASLLEKTRNAVGFDPSVLSYENPVQGNRIGQTCGIRYEYVYDSGGDLQEIDAYYFDGCPEEEGGTLCATVAYSGNKAADKWTDETGLGSLAAQEGMDTYPDWGPDRDAVSPYSTSTENKDKGIWTGSSVYEETSSTTYDEHGNPSEMAQVDDGQIATFTYEYDNEGRLVEETRTYAAKGLSDTYTYTYSQGGYLIATRGLEYAGGYAVNTYDSRGYLSIKRKYSPSLNL